MTEEETKIEILKVIFSRVNKYDNYSFDFDGEPIATDIISFQEETKDFMFDLTIQVWVKDTVWYGLELEDAEVQEFIIWDLDDNDVEASISDEEILQQIQIF